MIPSQNVRQRVGSGKWVAGPAKLLSSSGCNIHSKFQISQTVNYGYLWEGQWWFKKTGSTVQYYLRGSGGEWLGEYTNTLSGMNYLNLYGADMEGKWQIDYPSEYYYIKDHLGNIRQTLRDDGTKATVVSTEDYYPFGSTMRSSTTQLPALDKFKYQGKERDLETGYDYFEARMYDSQLGRFMQVDPFFDITEHHGLNPYHMGSNNPINRIDPTGKIDWPLNGFTAVNKADVAGGGWGLTNTVVRTSIYNEIRSEGTSPHSGIDYRADVGTDFYSLGDGKITAIGKTSAGAKFITVEYFNEDKIRFLHIDSITEGLTVGSLVYEGQVLGKTGISGTKLAHLHVDATDKNGNQINPEETNYGSVSNEVFFKNLNGNHKILIDKKRYIKEDFRKQNPKNKKDDTEIIWTPDTKYGEQKQV